LKRENFPTASKIDTGPDDSKIDSERRGRRGGCENELKNCLIVVPKVLESKLREESIKI